MKCALCRLLFISAAFCEGFIAAADAEEVNGPGAVRERIGPLIKGKTLQLASTGESAVPDFHVTTAHPGVLLDAGHAAGRDFLVMRQEKDGIVLSIGAGDWGVAPSLERPGWLELAAGNQTVFSFSLAERKVDMAPVGFVSDPVFNDRMHIDLGEGLRRFLAGEGVSSVRALETGGRWRLLGEWPDTAAFAVEFDSAGAWPVSATASRSRKGAVSKMAFATGPSVGKAWES